MCFGLFRLTDGDANFRGFSNDRANLGVLRAPLGLISYKFYPASTI